MAILGDMLELGADAPAYHADLAKNIAGIDGIFCVGPLMRHLYDLLPADIALGWHDDPATLDPQAIAALLRSGDAVVMMQDLLEETGGLDHADEVVDPDSFDENVMHDPQILSMAARVKMLTAAGQSREDLASTVAVTLKGGRVVTRRVTAFMGTPERPLDLPPSGWDPA